MNTKENILNRRSIRKFKNEAVDQTLWIYSFTRSVFNGFAQVLNVEILPNIKLGYLIAIPLVLSVLRFILGFFKGD